MAAHSNPGNVFPPLAATLTLTNSGIKRPVLIDVVSGEIRPLTWKSGTTDTLIGVPVRDSVMAIADEGYFDWDQLPEAPSSLDVHASGSAIDLSWEVHGGGMTGVAVERRSGNHGAWERVAKLGADAKSYRDAGAPSEQSLCLSRASAQRSRRIGVLQYRSRREIGYKS